MPDLKEDVNPVEPSTTEEQVSEEKAEDTATVTPEQETTTEQPQAQEQGKAQETEAVDEYGVPYKNRAAEWQRKFSEVANEDTIRKVAQEVIEQTKQRPAEQEYSISQLEQYAIENPTYRPWVEEQKAKLLQKQVAKITEEKVKEVEVKQKEAIVRQQSEQWVMNHPRLQECFTQDPFGRKVFNFQHPLTQMIGGYMREPDLQKRSDGLVIASKLALADYMESQASKTQKKVKTLEQNLKKVQKATLVEGSPAQQDVIKGKTKYNKAMENLHATGSKEALREVLKAKLGIE